MTILAYVEQPSLFRGTSNEVPLIFRRDNYEE